MFRDDRDRSHGLHSKRRNSQTKEFLSFEAAYERYQQIQCYKGKKNNVAIFMYSGHVAVSYKTCIYNSSPYKSAVSRVLLDYNSMYMYM